MIQRNQSQLVIVAEPLANHTNPVVGLAIIEIDN